MPLFGSSLFAKVPVYYYCLPVPRQLKFIKVIQACVYYCILHIKRLNSADNDRTLVYVYWFKSGRSSTFPYMEHLHSVENP